MRLPTYQFKHQNRYHPYPRYKLSRREEFIMNNEAGGEVNEDIDESSPDSLLLSQTPPPAYSLPEILSVLRDRLDGVSYDEDPSPLSSPPLLNLPFHGYEDYKPIDVLALAIYDDYVPGLLFQPSWADVVIDLALLFGRKCSVKKT